MRSLYHGTSLGFYDRKKNWVVAFPTTIEYPEANPREHLHVRAPGMDYFVKFESCFSRVEKWSSDLMSDKYQLLIYEDRTRWPTSKCPRRHPMPGATHLEIVPVCYV